MASLERSSQPVSRASAATSLIEFGPPVADRALLDSAPSADTLKFYLLTEAASRSWAAIARSLASGASEVFWIGGPAGVGKTHFLNYVMALEERAAAVRGRCAILRLGLEAVTGAFELEQRMVDLLAREIGAGDTGATLWRGLHSAEALGLALEQAHRVGIRAISVAIDFGATDAASWDDFFAELARVAQRSRQVAFNIYVGSRTRPPATATALQVAPAGGAEVMLAALARARRVADEPAAAALYDGTDLGGFAPAAIFPFDPRALETLRALFDEPASVATLARTLSAALAFWNGNARDGVERPLLSVELMGAAALARQAEERLGETGRAALRIAHHAAEAMEERGCARGIVDALMLERLGGRDRPLSPADLRARLPARHLRRGSIAAADTAIALMLEALSARTAGVIALDADRARFNPHAAGAPQVAAFNRALSLLQRFDGTLVEVADSPALRTSLKRAGDAMGRAAEAARRIGAILEAAEGELRAELTPEHRRTLDDFVTLAGAGASVLIEQAAAPRPRAQAQRVIAAYEALAAIAAAVPRIRTMREYLRGTALMSVVADSAGRDFAGDSSAAAKAVAAVQIECQLLLAALETGPLRWEPHGLDAFELRFQRFKWNYIDAYLAAHESRRRESERMAVELADAHDHFGALGRLNAIAALGAPVGVALGARIDEFGLRVTRCACDSPSALEFVPRCSGCGLVLGTVLPVSELHEVFAEMKRALRTKLAVLSRDTIAQLIRAHDRGHRLDGFLKITQAAQTDALMRVLDDNLARYLGRLLDEVQNEARDEMQDDARDRVPGVIEPFVRSRRDGVRPRKRLERPVRRPRE